jgi:hypothetical protein
MLLALASTVILRSTSSGTHDILLTRHLSGGPSPCIYIPQEQGGPVIPQALVSRFTSHNSQGINPYGVASLLQTVLTSAYCPNCLLFNSSGWPTWKRPLFPFNCTVVCISFPPECVYQATVHGRAITQAVSRWLPTTAAEVRSRVWSSGTCDGQSGTGAGFLQVLRFPLPIFIPPNCPSS